MSPAMSRSTSPGAPTWQGRRIGRFRLLSLLGQGAMGRVFRAEDTLLQRHVAMKVLRARAVAGSGRRVAVGRLIREARAAASLEHPHIVQVYDVNEAGGIFYIAMELLEGGSLKDLVTASGPLAPVTACQLAAEAAEALDHAHERGVIHRDVKPANLMLTRAGRCKVADFGLARVDDPGDLTSLTGEGVGTPRFVAPEVLRGAAATSRSDVYSLGASLWYLLTVRPPFPGETAAEVIREVLHSPLPDLRRLRPELSERLAETVCRALARDPARRYESADQFAKVLRVHTVPNVGDFTAFPTASSPAGNLAAGASGSSGGLSELADLVAGAPAATGSSYVRQRQRGGRSRALKKAAAVVLPVVVAVLAVGAAVWWAKQRSRQTAGPSVPPAAAPQPQPPSPPGPAYVAPAPEQAGPVDPRQAASQQPPAAPEPPHPVVTDLAAQIDLPPKPDGAWLVQKWGKGSDVKRQDAKLVMTGTGEEHGGAALIRKRSPEFDFFSAPVSVSAAELSFRGTGTPTQRRPLRVAFCSENSSGWLSRDAVSLWLGADRRVRLGYKLGKDKTDPEAVNVLEDRYVPGDITAFSLTLDAEGYDLTVRYEDPAGRDVATSYKGRFNKAGPGLKRESWGASQGNASEGKGDSALAIVAQQHRADPSHSATVEIGSLTASMGKAKAD